MLKSKYFWVTMLILAPFTIAWIMGGVFWATNMVVAFGLLFAIVSIDPKPERRGKYDDM